MIKRRIYTLTNLPPEVIAVAFAKTSRSQAQIDVIASELNEDKSRKFHEKWVIGYGHSSVAEHAVLSIAIENVSMLAAKIIEDTRLASYTERSSRYQIFRDYYIPRLEGKSLDLYKETIGYLLSVYNKLLPKLMRFLKNKYPKESEIRIKNKALDCVRYLLPVAMLTSLGMTINARSLEYTIKKLLSHELREIKEIGLEMKEAALKVTPTLIKYADYNSYLGETTSSLKELSKSILTEVKVDNTPGAKLVEYDKDAENKLVTALLYRFSDKSYSDIKKKVLTMSKKEKEMVIDEALKRLSKFDVPLRELEHVYYSFDILLDFGAFRDVQRHRMCTQTSQPLTVKHGYSVPEEIKEANLELEFRNAMEKAKSTYYELEKFEDACYVIPLGFYKRILITMNLREIYHFVKLRSSIHGHPAYRKIALQVYELVKSVHPLLAKYVMVKLE